MLPHSISSAEQQRMGQPMNGPPPNYANAGLQNHQPQLPPGHASGQSGIDFVGPVLRRKFFVGFLAIVGAALGFLAYSKSDAIYESTVRLMITSQAPPSIVNGESLVQRVAIAKHEKLISSQLILTRAIAEGNFANLATMKDLEPGTSLVKTLKEGVLKVNSSHDEDDTLVLRAQGKHSEDLPTILNFVVQSFKDEIAKDSKASGQESVELVSKLRDQLRTEKQASEEQYLTILKRLNLPNVEQNGILVNPYSEELDRVSRSRTETITTLRDVSDRLELANKAAASDEPSQATYLVAEAKKFLGVAIETVETIEDDRKGSGRQYLGSQYTQRIFALEREISELTIRRETNSRSFASGHPVIIGLDSQIASAKQQLLETAAQLQKMDQQVGLTDQDQDLVSEKLEKRNRQWIEIYQASLLAEKERLSKKLGQLDQDFSSIEALARSVSSDFLELNVLQSRIAEKQKGIDEVLSRLSEINVVSNNFNDTKVRIIDEANIGEKIAPSLLKHLAIGLFLGGLLGVGLAVLIDRSDMTYRNPGEIYERLKVPVISKIPAIRGNKKSINGKGSSPALVALHRPTSAVAEAIRAARTALFFTAQNEGAKVFLLTSPSPGDGKSTTCANLAISIAQAGKKVVLLDADFRRPRVHSYFGEGIEPGVLQAVSGSLELEDCFQASEQENLTLLTSGGRPKNPGEIVTSYEFGQMIQFLREKFDVVLIDSPPLLPVADAATISSLVDGVYMVMRIRKGVVVTSSKAKEKLDMVSARLLGVIVNGIDDNPHYNEYGSYGYGYGYSGYGSYGYGNGRYYESRNSKYQEKIAMKD